MVRTCSIAVNAITRAMGRYPNGDDFCWKRSKTHVAKAKRALLAGAAQYRKSGQWAVALAFAREALPLAEKMPTFNSSGHNSDRDLAIAGLEKLKADAKEKLRE